MTTYSVRALGLPCCPPFRVSVGLSNASGGLVSGPLQPTLTELQDHARNYSKMNWKPHPGAPDSSDGGSSGIFV